jgi:putative endonuclease
VIALLKRIKGFFFDRSDRNCISHQPRFAGAGSGGAGTVARGGPLTRREVGAKGEKLAVDFLKGLGYEILERNFRCRQGEIDIIARHDGCLVFIEVRTKKSSDFGTPEESVTSSKKEKLIALAEAYLQTLDSPPLSWRIDVVAVELSPNGEISRLEHIENAVN